MNRRDILRSALALGLGGALAGCGRDAPLIERDRHAQGEFELYDLGLVPVERSGWTRPEGAQPPFPALAGDIDADIVVVGAGLAGSSLALHLAERGVRVAVLEARQPGWGASGRNAGHVLPLLRDFGVLEAFPGRGKAFLEAFREHLTIPFDLSQRLQIDCDAVRSGYLNVMTGADDIDKFTREFEHLSRLGIQKLRRMGREEVHAQTGTSRFDHGVMLEDGGRVNPYLFTNGMAMAAVRLGAAVHGDSEALRIEGVGRRWRVATARGSVRADRAVFCTNAYPTAIVPEFASCFYPLTAYALTTRPLAPQLQSQVMPGRATLAQYPIDLNPLVRDRHDRLVLSSIPAIAKPQDAAWHFASQLTWLHRTWPATRDVPVELETYWTGRVAMRDVEFPGAYELQPGLYGLMHFNAWGNVMAPLMGMLLAEALAADRPDRLPFPLTRPRAVEHPGRQHRNIRQLMIPAARTAQRLGII